MLERELTRALEIAQEGEKAGTPKTPKQIEDPKRSQTIDAIAAIVRDEIEFAFSPDDTKAIAKATSLERFLKDGATLVARNPVDPDAAGQREYILDNRRITEIGGAVEVDEERNGNAQESQNPLDVYMKGLRVLLERVLKEIKTTSFAGYEVKVVVTDTLGVEEGKRNRIEIHDALSHFTPPKASSKGTK